MKKIALILILMSSTGTATGQVNFYIYKYHDKFTLNPWMRYTSVEGAFTGVSGQYFVDDHLKLQTDFGYAWAARVPRYAIRIDQSLPVENNEWVLAAEYKRSTSTPDARLLPDWQNSLSSLFLRRDFYQHYEVHGVETEFGHIWEGTVSLRAFGGLRDFSSMKNHTNFSLLGWADKRIGVADHFDVNAPVIEGRDVYAGVRFGLDTRPSPLAPVSAWIADGTYSNSALFGDVAGNDFSYQRLYLKLTGQLMAFKTHRMLTTLIMGSFEGDIRSADSTAMAEQFLFDGGGYGTLRGYGYREFSNNNRMLMLKWDYSFNGSFLPKTALKKIWGIGSFFSLFDVALFADAGYFWTTKENTPFYKPAGFKSEDFLADAGIGLSAKDWVRFEFAFPLRKGIQTKPGDWSFYFNLRGNL